jgi:hypothetical protein
LKLKQYHVIITGLNDYPELRSLYFPLLVFSFDLFHSNKVFVHKINSLFGQLINSVFYDPIMNELIGSFISEEEEQNLKQLTEKEFSPYTRMDALL